MNPRLRRGMFHAATVIYFAWLASCIVVLGFGHTPLLLVLLAAGMTVFGLFTGTVVAVCRRRDHTRTRRMITATPDTEQFVTLMRALGAGDLEQLGLDS